MINFLSDLSLTYNTEDLITFIINLKYKMYSYISRFAIYKRDRAGKDGSRSIWCVVVDSKQ